MIPLTKIVVSFYFDKHLLQCINETIGFIFRDPFTANETVSVASCMEERNPS
jgi:hypothetical protein